MEIRLANTSDIPGMIRLLRQVGQVHHDIRPDLFRDGAQKYSPSDLEALLQDAARPIFVGVEDGRMLGYCFCILEEVKDNPVLCDVKSLYIDDLCVDESRRGQHIGSALYDHAVAYAREIGCNFLTLTVWGGNDGAMKFYEKAGMTPRNIHMEMKLC